MQAVPSLVPPPPPPNFVLRYDKNGGGLGTRLGRASMYAHIETGMQPEGRDRVGLRMRVSLN